MLIGIEWHDMSTKPCLNGESRDISKVVLISMGGGIIDGLAHYDYEVDAWYTDGVNVEHKMIKPKYWAYRNICNITYEQAIDRLKWLQRCVKERDYFEKQIRDGLLALDFGEEETK